MYNAIDIKQHMNAQLYSILACALFFLPNWSICKILPLSNALFQITLKEFQLSPLHRNMFGKNTSESPVINAKRSLYKVNACIRNGSQSAQWTLACPLPWFYGQSHNMQIPFLRKLMGSHELVVNSARSNRQKQPNGGGMDDGEQF